MQRVLKKGKVLVGYILTSGLLKQWEALLKAGSVERYNALWASFFRGEGRRLAHRLGAASHMASLEILTIA